MARKKVWEGGSQTVRYTTECGATIKNMDKEFKFTKTEIALKEIGPRIK